MVGIELLRIMVVRNGSHMEYTYDMLTVRDLSIIQLNSKLICEYT